MTRFAPIVAAATFSILSLVAVPAAAAPQQVTNLTTTFQTAGVSIDRLQVYEIGGVVVLRGRTYNRAEAEKVGRTAVSLGYGRVANLIQVLAAPDDAHIERLAERELTSHRGLDGCKFTVDASHGVLHVAGSVRHEMQKDMALAVLRTVKGVTEVRSNLTRIE